MKHSGIIAAGLICLFAAYLLMSSFSLTSKAGAALGPAFMPRMLGIILLALGAADLAGEIKREKEQREKDRAGRSRIPEPGQGQGAAAKPAKPGEGGPEPAMQKLADGDGADGGPEPAAAAARFGSRAWIAKYVDVLSIPLLLAYVYSMKSAGFLLSSMAYMFLHMLLLTVNKKRNYPLLILLAVLVPSVIYFCFVKLFYLMLPTGILG